ncbi:MAG: hypothetical protein ACYC5Y_03945 [Symbiobacteriia bacterium]
MWDKTATIRFKRPEKNSIDRQYVVDLVDVGGTVHTTIEKTLYIRRAPKEATP